MCALFDSLPKAEGIYAMVMACVCVCVCMCVCIGRPWCVYVCVYVTPWLVNTISQEVKVA